MSDGAYRDDQEAALARATALEDELADERRENAKLRAENEALAHRAELEPEPFVLEPRRRASRGPHRGLALALIGFSVIAVVVVAYVASRRPKVAAPVRAIETQAAHRRAVAAWTGTRYAAVCLRNASNHFAWESLDEVATDPRHPGAAVPDFSEAAMSDLCMERLGTLVGIPAATSIPPPEYASIAHDLRRWLDAASDYGTVRDAISRYYAERQWISDNYASAPEKWRGLRTAATARTAAAQAVQDRLLAITHTELRRYVDAYEAHWSRDETWWALELGYLLQIVADDDWFGNRARVEAELAAFNTRVFDAPVAVQLAARAARDARLASKEPFENNLIKDLEPVP